MGEIKRYFFETKLCSPNVHYKNGNINKLELLHIKGKLIPFPLLAFNTMKLAIISFCEKYCRKYNILIDDGGYDTKSIYIYSNKNIYYHLGFNTDTN